MKSLHKTPLFAVTLIMIAVFGLVGLTASWLRLSRANPDKQNKVSPQSITPQILAAEAVIEVPVAAATSEPEAVAAEQDILSAADLAGLIYLSEGLWEVTGSGSSRLLFEPQAGAAFLELSPDNSQVLYSSPEDNDIWLHDLGTGTVLNLTQTNDRLESGYMWWPQNPDTIVFNFRNAGASGLNSGHLGWISLLEPGYNVFEQGLGSFSAAALSPDGKTIAFDRGQELWLYEMGAHAERIELSSFNVQPEKIWNPAWSPDGQQLALVVSIMTGDADAPTLATAILDFEQGTSRILHPYTPVAGSSELPQIVWSPDGEWLALTNPTEGIGSHADFWVVSVDGSREIYLGSGLNPLWHPVERRLLYIHLGDGQNDFEVRSFDLETERSQPVDHPELPAFPGILYSWRTIKG